MMMMIAMMVIIKNDNNDDDNDDYHYQLLTLPSTFIIWKSSIDNSPSRPEKTHHCTGIAITV